MNRRKNVVFSTHEGTPGFDATTEMIHNFKVRTKVDSIFLTHSLKIKL